MKSYDYFIRSRRHVEKVTFLKCYNINRGPVNRVLKDFLSLKLIDINM